MMLSTKVCSACKQEKALVDFPPDRRRKDERGTKCRVCARIVARAYYARYPAKEAERRLKNAEAGRRWYERNREKQVRHFKWKHIERRAIDYVERFDSAAVLYKSGS